jgi:protein-tyrosine-phosphatase
VRWARDTGGAADIHWSIPMVRPELRTFERAVGYRRCVEIAHRSRGTWSNTNEEVVDVGLPRRWGCRSSSDWSFAMVTCGPVERVRVRNDRAVPGESLLALQAARIETSFALFSSGSPPRAGRSQGRRQGHADSSIIVFFCVHNAGRSQMRGWASALAGDRSKSSPAARPASGWLTLPSKRWPSVDIASFKPWTDEILRAADVIVTMGCGDACPIFPGKRYEDWEVDDPAGLGVEAVRPIRADIEIRVRRLLEGLGVLTP